MENKKHSFDLGELLSEYQGQLTSQYSFSPDQSKVLTDLTCCRTSALGGHKDYCNHCGHVQNSYNSCRNRHCPKCQYIKQAEWVDRLKHNLPPTKYFHLIFTIPQELHQIFYTNQRLCYDLLFRSSTKAVHHASGGPSGYGASVGGVSLLHTWGQALTYHPHIHMLVPAGGLSADKMEWIHSPGKFFLPAKVLSKIFRGIVCKMLSEIIAKGEEIFLPDDFSWDKLKQKLYKNNWNVHIKSHQLGADRVIEYLGRYTHRVAISNSRIISVKDDQISFKIKDNRTGAYSSTITLPVIEFHRRFFQHVVPRGFCRIRYFGFMSLSIAKEMLALVFELLEKAQFIPRLEGLNAMEVFQEISGKRQRICPECGIGILLPFHGATESG
ncbi:MAG: IS91 family transposase [Candidatus Marinimicrobia bacterium]|nr:IS91 family transposase [Candidatus Neomarinimicrobiota bacterium]